MKASTMMSECNKDATDRRGELTRILQDAGHDESHRARHLLPLVYEELRALARARMAREDEGHTIQATALVHEAFIRLVTAACITMAGWRAVGTAACPG